MSKPFSEFETGSAGGIFSFNQRAENISSGTLFAANSQGSTQVRFHRGIIITEPEEYALVFGLLALGFVFFRRHFQKKQRQVQAITS